MLKGGPAETEQPVKQHSPRSNYSSAWETSESEEEGSDIQGLKAPRPSISLFEDNQAKLKEKGGLGNLLASLIPVAAAFGSLNGNAIAHQCWVHAVSITLRSILWLWDKQLCSSLYETEVHNIGHYSCSCLHMYSHEVNAQYDSSLKITVKAGSWWLNRRVRLIQDSLQAAPGSAVSCVARVEKTLSSR